MLGQKVESSSSWCTFETPRGRLRLTAILHLFVGVCYFLLLIGMNALFQQGAVFFTMLCTALLEVSIATLGFLASSHDYYVDSELPLSGKWYKWLNYLPVNPMWLFAALIYIFFVYAEDLVEKEINVKFAVPTSTLIISFACTSVTAILGCAVQGLTYKYFSEFIEISHLNAPLFNEGDDQTFVNHDYSLDSRL